VVADVEAELEGDELAKRGRSRAINGGRYMACEIESADRSEDRKKTGLVALQDDGR
jgi:hypothetical protein